MIAPVGVIVAVAAAGTASVLSIWLSKRGREFPEPVRTRGDQEEFRELGVLYATSGKQADAQKNNVLPLFGAPIYRKSHRWNYYTEISGREVPLRINGVNCMTSVGCNELNDNDHLEIPQLDNVFTYDAKYD